MRMVYICSPYRAKDGAELDRHIEYAQALTKQAIEAGLAPITPHLYMTQCLNEDKPQERAAGMAAGLALLEKCDFVIAGVKYGISEGMSREIQTAIKRYAHFHACDFCKGRHFHTCALFYCKESCRQAYEYAETHFTSG